MKVALTVPLLPSVTVASPIEAVGATSSSVIVAAPCVSAPSVPLSTVVRLTKNCSFPSGLPSPLTSTEIVPVVLPGLIVIVWLNADS